MDAKMHVIKAVMIAMPLKMIFKKFSTYFQKSLTKKVGSEMQGYG
jgi:hypothetical protein